MGKKMNKAEMVEVLESANTEDKTLKEQIAYTLKKVKENIKGVSLIDLSELVNQITALPTVAVETSPKPKLTTKKASAPAPKEEKAPAKSTKVNAPAKSTDKAKAPADKKTEDKKPAEKSNKVQTAPQPTSNGRPAQAKMFPKEVELSDGTTIVSCFDAYKTYTELFEAINEGKTLYIVCYWTAKHIKQFKYAELTLIPNAPKEFENDLDVLTAIATCETMERVYAMSLYTEGMFLIDGDDLTYVEDKDPATKEKYKVRVSNGMEFELYRPISEDILQIDEGEDEDNENSEDEETEE